MHEGRALEPHFNKGGLHSREHPNYFGEVNVANNSPLARTLNLQLLDRCLLNQCHPRFLRGDVDQNLFIHIQRVLQ